MITNSIYFPWYILKEDLSLRQIGKKKFIVKIYIFWFELKFQELCCKQDQQKEKEK